MNVDVGLTCKYRFIFINYGIIRETLEIVLNVLCTFKPSIRNEAGFNIIKQPCGKKISVHIHTSVEIVPILSIFTSEQPNIMGDLFVKRDFQCKYLL